MRRQPLIQRANDQDISKYGFIVEDTGIYYLFVLCSQGAG